MSQCDQCKMSIVLSVKKLLHKSLLSFLYSSLACCSLQRPGADFGFPSPLPSSFTRLTECRMNGPWVHFPRAPRLLGTLKGISLSGP